jgi:putative CocE/NonD family hydrolase
MRDGASLATDVMLPQTVGPYPTVLIRTPYDKVFALNAPQSQVKGIPYDQRFLSSLNRAGYALAVQDVRGRFNSDGEWYPYFSERGDGQDTIEWLAQQSWCNGNVGMVGRSYAGYTQWMAATTTPSALKAMVPLSAQRSLFQGYPIVNGAMWMANCEIAVKMGRHTYQVADYMKHVYRQAEDYFGALPLEIGPESAGVSPPRWWQEMMSHPNFDDFWRRGSYELDWGKIHAPAFNVTGWYDMTLSGALANFTGMRRAGGSDAARNGQRLVVGPWGHWANSSAETDAIKFGKSATADLQGSVLRFLDRWLKDQHPEADNESHVRLFVMGANEWWGSDSWPLSEAIDTRFFLHSDGDANGSRGRGRLSIEPPTDERADSYHYNPETPTGASWSMLAGPVDERPATDRPDVLCYTSAAFSRQLDVVGPITCELHAASSARDTDWHIRLADVHPDGYAQFLTHGLIRARFRESLEQPKLLTPGRPEVFRIDVGATANRFLPGHRVRLEISSSWFPQFDRNLNSGADNNFRDVEPVSANQTIFHDAARPSSVLLPVISPNLDGVIRGFES